MRLTKINITPVKGTRIQRVESEILGMDGVSSNRRFFFINENGALINGKFIGQLTKIISRYEPITNRLGLEFPDGTLLEEPVRLGDDVIETNFYGRSVYGRLVIGPWGKAVSDFTVRDVRLVQVLPGITATDVHPVTIITASTLEYLKSRSNAPDERWSDRFRMLLEIDGGVEFIEDGWIGSEIRIGEAVVRVAGPVPRCVVTTRNPVTGESDFQTLLALRQIRGENLAELGTPTEHLPDGGKILLGVYADVVKPGKVWEGCSVHTRDAQN